ncbi:MAG: hypothetical protein HGB26_01435 [Desulfobulbaceae bacterium]|nr:hypothetical protein [Desulfobulbaceae bacterium]
MRLTRQQIKQKLSDRGRRAAYARWDAYHALLAATEPPHLDPPADMYRITVENLLTGKTDVMTFHPGPRINNYLVDVNGQPWRVCGFVDALRRIEKSCAKMARITR